jgi:hypothetical protein
VCSSIRELRLPYLKKELCQTRSFQKISIEIEKKSAKSKRDRTQTPSILAYHDLKPYVYGKMHQTTELKSPLEDFIVPK